MVKKKILAVDDNSINLQLLERILKKDYEVLTSSTGSDALRICREQCIDLILLDVIMPEMDGYEACKKLKENLRTRHIPVIFLTAKAKSEDIVRGFEAGGVDYVAKPFNKIELLARVKTHIELDTLRGILPFCCVCGLIRDDTGVESGKGEWIKADEFISRKTDAQVSHCYCPTCYEKTLKDDT